MAKIYFFSFYLFFTGFAQAQFFQTEKAIRIPTTDGISLEGELYSPSLHKVKLPIVIAIHGGSWNSRSPGMDEISKQIAKSGWVALNTTYRLAPQNKYPKALQDIQSAIQWVSDNAEKYKLDTDRIFLWGYSAGGHLALLAGLSDPRVKGIVSGAGPTDLTFYAKSQLVLQFLGEPIAKQRKLWDEASPINKVSEKSPPVFIFHGEKDQIVSIVHAERLEKKLKQSKVPVEFIRNPKANHHSVDFFMPNNVNKALEFLRKHMK